MDPIIAYLHNTIIFEALDIGGDLILGVVWWGDFEYMEFRMQQRGVSVRIVGKYERAAEAYDALYEHPLTREGFYMYSRNADSKVVGRLHYLEFQK